MKVLMVNAAYRGGGAERATRELLHGLLAQGVDVELMVGKRDPSDPDQVTKVRVSGEKYLKVVERFIGPVDWRHLGSRRAFRKVRGSHYDVVHLHNVHGGWCSLGALQDLCRRLPVVWTFHDEWPVVPGLAYDLSRWMSSSDIRTRFPGRRHVDGSDPASRRLAKRISPRLPTVDQIICHSRYMQRLIQESPLWHQTGTRLVHLPVEMANRDASRTPRSDAKHFVGVAPDQATVGLVAARLESVYKGMHFAIDAINQVERDLQVVVVGRQAEALARKIRHPVRLLGYLSDDDMLAKAYRSMDVLLLPSLVETFGLVSAEALACETPVVAFATTAISEVVADGQRGFSVRPFDTSEMASRVEMLLENPSIASSLGSRGREWVVKNCTTESYIRSTIEAYEAARHRRCADSPHSQVGETCAKSHTLEASANG